jgi:hypothetical protein
MSENYETIADVEATEDEAESLGQSVLSWLIDSGIVVAEASDCVAGGSGHAPGPRWADAVSDPSLGRPHLWANGLEVDVGRSWFHAGEFGVEEVTCPYCDTVTQLGDDGGEPPSAWQPFSRAIKEYHEGGQGVLDCPACKRPVGLNAWTWGPPTAFGELGFTFWNWPLLSPKFIAELSRRLGHRTVRVDGRL